VSEETWNLRNRTLTSDCLEAADEIDRLRSVLLRIRNSCGSYIPATEMDAIDKALGIPIPRDGVFRAVESETTGL
jgi:hypothetical protein